MVDRRTNRSVSHRNPPRAYRSGASELRWPRRQLTDDRGPERAARNVASGPRTWRRRHSAAPRLPQRGGRSAPTHTTRPIPRARDRSAPRRRRRPRSVVISRVMISEGDRFGRSCPPIGRDSWAVSRQILVARAIVEPRHLGSTRYAGLISPERSPAAGSRSCPRRSCGHALGSF
jgi:hypothetical protein